MFTEMMSKEYCRNTVLTCEMGVRRGGPLGLLREPAIPLTPSPSASPSSSSCTPHNKILVLYLGSVNTFMFAGAMTIQFVL